MPRAESIVVSTPNLKDALTALAERLEGQEALTITGVRQGGVWRVQGSVPVQRPPACEPCGIAGGGHRDWCPEGRASARCCSWFGLGHAPTCERATR